MLYFSSLVLPLLSMSLWTHFKLQLHHYFVLNWFVSADTLFVLSFSFDPCHGSSLPGAHHQCFPGICQAGSGLTLAPSPLATYASPAIQPSNLLPSHVDAVHEYDNSVALLCYNFLYEDSSNPWQPFTPTNNATMMQSGTSSTLLPTPHWWQAGPLSILTGHFVPWPWASP